jgi:hypothetical protein
LKSQTFPEPTFILQKLTLLWEHGLHEWSQLIGRDPNGRPYFLDERELQWANPSMIFPLPQRLAHTLIYLRALLSAKNLEEWRRLKPKISGPEAIDLSIAPRWRDIFAPAWGTLPERPSPHAISKASRQPTMMEALGNIPPPTAQSTDREGTRIVLRHFKPRRKKGFKRNPASKRKPTPTIEPLRGSDAPGGNASILSILARAEQRKVKHNRRFTYVEELLVQWGPEICTLD